MVLVMRLCSFGCAVVLIFVARSAGAMPPTPHAFVTPPAPAPHTPLPVAPATSAPHAVAPLAKTPHDTSPSPTSPLFAPKRPAETPDSFFTRAAREVARGATTRTGQLSPQGREAVDELARAAGYHAIRNVVVGGGVVGSQSGNGYVHYYRNGWNEANLPVKAEAPIPFAPAPPARRNPALESEVRAMLAKTPDGRRALDQLEHSKTTILFREGGGTSNNGDQHELYIDVKMKDGGNKPLSWLALSVAHEASHAYDDATGATPRTLSALHDEYAEKRAQTAVPTTLRIALVKDRADYVDGQVAGEARAMTSETRLRRDLEAQGVDFAGLNTTLLDPYNQAIAKVYAAAGLRASP